jgi:hypothetical protein
MNLIKELKVYNVHSPKIRLGRNSDGGYIINELIEKNSRRLISLGMADEDSFEKDWVFRHPEKPVEAYDGSTKCGALCLDNPNKVNKTIFYTQQNIGYNNHDIPLNVILDEKPGVLLKVDIEYNEYSIFEHANLDNITGLVLEVHGLDDECTRNKLVELLHTKFNNLVLFHIHGNSCGDTFDYQIDNIKIPNFPRLLELSFVNKTLVTEVSLETNKFPVTNLDFSNGLNEDLDLHWVNSEA